MIDLQQQASRFKQIRNLLGYDNQEDFGDELGKYVGDGLKKIAKTTISKYENGKLAVANKVLVALFSHYGVNKTWWETGIGEPLLPAAQQNKIEHQDFGNTKPLNTDPLNNINAVAALLGTEQNKDYREGFADDYNRFMQYFETTALPLVVYGLSTQIKANTTDIETIKKHLKLL